MKLIHIRLYKYDDLNFSNMDLNRYIYIRNLAHAIYSLLSNYLKTMSDR